MMNTCGDYAEDHRCQGGPHSLCRDLQDMEWDERWDEAFAQPVEEGSPMWELEQEVKANSNARNAIDYVPGKSLSELFAIDPLGIVAS